MLSHWGVGMYIRRLTRRCQWPGCGREFATTASNALYCHEHQHDAELRRHARWTARMRALVSPSRPEVGA